MKAMAGKADQRPAYLYIDILRCTATYLVIALPLHRIIFCQQFAVWNACLVGV